MITLQNVQEYCCIYIEGLVSKHTFKLHAAWCGTNYKEDRQDTLCVCVCERERGGVFC